jgi:hypothetical protein
MLPSLIAGMPAKLPLTPGVQRSAAGGVEGTEAHLMRQILGAFDE